MTRAAPKISEAAFTRLVLDLAKLKGWRTAHFRTAQNGRGQYRTPVAGDGKGFPDLVLVRPGPGTEVDGELEEAPGRGFDQKLAYLRDAAISAQAYGHDAGRVILAELKRDGSYPEPEQRTWLAMFAVTATVEVYVWRPSDWDEIAQVLA